MTESAPPTSRTEVWFDSEGVRCAGTLYRPNVDRPVPAIVLSHGFASVRTMHLPDFAAAFTAAGFAVLTVDYRYLGDSGGEPRQQVLPHAQRDDLRNALTFLGEQPGVDADRLGLWGTSFAGGHALHIAAFDRRVRAVVSQVPGVGTWHYLTAELPAADRDTLLRTVLAARLEHAATGTEPKIPITAPAGTDSVLGPDDHAWHVAAERAHATFRNEITLRSLDDIVGDDPAAFVASIAPTPLLMIVGAHDTTTPPRFARAVFERAGEPKRLVEFDGDHYDVYDDPTIHTTVATAAADFFIEHL